MTFTKEQAFEEVKRLVDEFAEEVDELKTRQHVKEAQVEDKYIKPLWAALNWNVTGKGQVSRRQEFVVQGTIRSRKGTFVEPDYILRLPDNKGRMRDKLYIEAKLPKYPLIEMRTPEVLRYVRQAYRYAHMKTAQSEDPDKWVRLSILTDFEEFLLFDCVDSAPLEKGNEHLLKKAIVEPFPWTFDRYVTDFDFLWETFEQKQVAEGSLEKLKVTSQDRIKKRLPPDKRFLEDIDRWRKELATSMWRLNRKNPNFNDALLSAATQLIIDRLVFVKMLSDKGIEPDYLSELLSDLNKLKDSNVSLFQACKSRFSLLNTLYNGTVFSDRAELDLMPVENKILIEILQELDPEYAPYTLASLDVRIIGNAYEQYLGKVLHSDGRGVSMPGKPEVIKANGVYYTPGYIVEYIVENTLGELLKTCKSPEDVSRLKILDPACGSGSFLLTAYDFILRWYQDYFVKERKVEKKYREFAEIIKLPDGGEVIRLTANLKRNILLNNIYGVDIDPQAVEVAQFSLCMKALDGISDRMELDAERNLYKQTILPNMSNNIKCGNSLIGTDYFGLAAPTAEEIIDIKPFDWKTEFNIVIDSGGFDAMIGNPPYHSVKLMKQSEKKYYYHKYKVADKRFNIFSLFIERGANIIIKKGGKFGFIIPSAILANSQYLLLRNLLLENFTIRKIVDFKGGVFVNANIETLILLMDVKDDIVQITDENNIQIIYDISNFQENKYCEKIQRQGDFRKTIGNTFTIGNVISTTNKTVLTLGEMVVIRNGINTGNIADKIVVKKKINTFCKPLIDGKDVQRYEPIVWRNQYILYDTGFVEKLRKEWAEKGLDWTARIIKKENYFEKDKLVVQRIRNLSLERRLVFTYDENKYYTSINIGVVTSKKDSPYDLRYFLGILNSAYMNNYFKRHFHSIQIKNQFLEQLPIPTIDFANNVEKTAYEQIVSLANQMLELQKTKSTAKIQSEICTYERQIEATDQKIDSLVYKLYGLTEDEIKIIES